MTYEQAIEALAAQMDDSLDNERWTPQQRVDFAVMLANLSDADFDAVRKLVESIGAK